MAGVLKLNCSGEAALPPQSCRKSSHRGEGALADHPLKDTAEIEIICPHCGYRMMRAVARLRREYEIDCPSCGKLILPPASERTDDSSS